MLSYRHAFHAGNHADILKHCALTLILESLTKKEKPFAVIDTHAGAGIYALDDERAVKTGETAAGILRLLDAPDSSAPQALQPYLSLCRRYAASGRYPGSPEIARTYLREKDRLVLMELHTAEIDVLKSHMRSGAQVGIHHRDGYAGAVALTPPAEKRGLLLMDPSYEVDSDYINAAETLCAVHKKWSNGILALWYPLLNHRRADIMSMTDRICDFVKNRPGATGADVYDCRFELYPPEQPAGLYGSGMLIVNPPWHFAGQMESVLPYIRSCLL